MPTPDEQREEIARLHPRSPVALVAGQSYYVVPTSWWSAWAAHVGWEDVASPHKGPAGGVAPGQIDTSSLLDVADADDGRPRRLVGTLTEGPDFVVVGGPTWEALLGWYGGGPPIERPAILVGGGAGNRPKETQLELNLLRLKCYLRSDDAALSARAGAAPLIIALSKADNVRRCAEAACRGWQLDASRVRLWDYLDQVRHDRLADLETSLQDVPLCMDQEMLVEVQNADGSWPIVEVAPTADATAATALTGCSSVATGAAAAAPSAVTVGSATTWGPGASRAVPSGREDTVVDSSPPQQPGVVGLSNLGNTCFMNSMLQCLSNVAPLRDFFLRDDFAADLNAENPLGTEGELAAAFSSLLKLVWGNGASVISPRSFKAVLGRHAPQFSGYAQHDSQELCNYVLDKLHEDVNRVRKKPYVENFEANGEPDRKIIEEVRRRHQLRNDSRVSDLFEGFFKSTVVCPVTGHTSVTFDPYMSVALPLGASDASRTLAVSLRRLDGSVHKHTATLPQAAKMEALVAAVAEQASLPPARLVATELYNSRVHKTFEGDEQLERLYDNDSIVLYETSADRRAEAAGSSAAHEASPAGGEAAEAVATLVVQQKDRDRASSRAIGLPIVLTVPADIDGRRLTALLEEQTARYRGGSGPPTPMDVEPPVITGGVPVALVCGGDSAMDETEPQVVTGAEPEASSDADDPVVLDGVLVPPPAWSLHLTKSDWDPPGEPLDPEGDAPVLGDGGASASESRYLVLLWSPEAFDGGGYVRARIEDEVAEAAALTCSKPVAAATRPAVALRDCFELFRQEEVLDGDNLWYCPCCKEHREGRKRMQFWSMPDLLVVHLKRFSAHGQCRRKLDTPVDFPIEGLDLTEFCLRHSGEDADGERAVYDLQAVSNHFGSTGGGHYTAFAKNADTDKWYKFDDSHTSFVPDPATVVTPAAYVLIYSRRKS